MPTFLVRALLPSLCAVSLGVAHLHADALDARRVPAEVRWFAHVDVDAFDASSCAAALRGDEAFELGPDPFGLGAELGLDLFRDLCSVTLFTFTDGIAAAESVRVEARSGDAGARVALGVAKADAAASRPHVALFTCRASVEPALARLTARPEHRTETLDGRALHVWPAGSASIFAWFGETQVAGDPGASKRLVVQSNDRSALARALAVLDGRAPNLADAPEAVLRARPAAGSFLFAAASTRLAELADVQLASNVARLAEEFALDVGETRGSVFARLSVAAESEREALQIQQVLQGGVALLGLVAGGDADDAELRALQALTGAFRFQARGTAVQAEFELPVATFLDAVRAFGLERGAPESGKK